MSNKFFFLEESPFYKDKYIIKLNHEKFLFPTGTEGSFNVIISRVLNLSYASYLRYARDRLGAELIGKGTRYVIPYFLRDEKSKAFIDLLNSRMKYIMHEHNFPFEYKQKEDGTVERIPFTQNENNS